MLTRWLILLKRTAAPQMSECMAKPDKQFAGPASPYAHTHTLSLSQRCEQSWHTELPTLASEERERERQKLQEKAREGEKRRKPQQMKNSVSEVCPFAVKAWFCIDQFQSSSGISTLPTSWLRRECALAQTQWWQSWWVCKNLWWPFKRFLKLLNLQSSPITHVQDNNELN